VIKLLSKGNLLVTGGYGYIGSHTVVELLSENEDVIIVDNLSNSSIKVLERVKEITGKLPTFIEADICDKAAVKNVCRK
jgi:UDP-glucose 4-epimerase